MSGRTNKLVDVISAVAPLTDALREPAKKRRSPAKGTPKPAVGTSYACRCGYRTDDQRDYQAHLLAEIDDLRSELAEVGSGMPRRADGTRFVAECGTPAGAHRHWRKGEEICESCLEARRKNDRERSRVRKQESADYGERVRTYAQSYRARPEYQEQKLKYQERQRARAQTPEQKAKKRAYDRALYARKKAERGDAADA